MITKEIALSLKYKEELYHTVQTDSRGNPVKCRVNGKCKTWKTRPQDFRLPVKHGLNSCFYITPINAAYWGKED